MKLLYVADFIFRVSILIIRGPTLTIFLRNNFSNFANNITKFRRFWLQRLVLNILMGQCGITFSSVVQRAEIEWGGMIARGSLQELGEKFSINNDPILHFDFF